MAHGYMREFDEDRGRWRDDDRERGSWGHDRDHRDQDDNERNLSFMLGDRDRDWSRSDSRYEQRSDWERAPRNFSSHQDDHYRSWRDKQMEALDRDYQDYCREREQQFHSDFDTWRSQRHGNQEPLRTGMTQTAQSGDPTGTLELRNEISDPAADPADPMETATLGTSSSRNRR